MWDPPQKASPVSKHLGPLEIIPIEGIHDKSQQQTTWGVVYLCEFHIQRLHKRAPSLYRGAHVLSGKCPIKMVCQIYDQIWSCRARVLTTGPRSGCCPNQRGVSWNQPWKSIDRSMDLSIYLYIHTYIYKYKYKCKYRFYIYNIIYTYTYYDVLWPYIYTYNIMSYYYIVHCNWLWFIYVCINMLNVIDVVDHGAPLSLLNTGDTSAALRGAVSLIGENPNVSVRALGSWPCRKSSTQKSSDSLSCSPCFFCDFGYTPFSHTHTWRDGRIIGNQAPKNREYYTDFSNKIWWQWMIMW